MKIRFIFTIMTETKSRCDICLSEISDIALIRDGVCTLRICKPCYQKTDGITCPHCKVPYAWAQAAPPPQSSTFILNEILAMLNQGASASPSPTPMSELAPPAPALVPAPRCLHQRCQISQNRGELCTYHYNDTYCNKIIVRGVNRTRCGHKANKHKYCKHHS
jgi:hypothetical protein